MGGGRLPLGACHAHRGSLPPGLPQSSLATSKCSSAVGHDHWHSACGITDRPRYHHGRGAPGYRLGDVIVAIRAAPSKAANSMPPPDTAESHMYPVIGTEAARGERACAASAAAPGFARTVSFFLKVYVTEARAPLPRSRGT